MPTGYTHAVQEGKTTELNEFVMTCARAFGALMMMRDEPSDALIPDAFQPSTYNAEALTVAEKRRALVLAMSDAEAEEAAATEHQEEMTRRTERLARIRDERLRYEAMLDKVRGWKPPSPDHVELKNFMKEQLRESIRFDCGDALGKLHEAPVEKLSGPDWKAMRLADLDQSIDRRRKLHEDEVRRTDGRNLWVRQLRESLAAEAMP